MINYKNIIKFVNFSALSLLSQITLLMTNILLANRLSGDDYGKYSLFMSIASFGILISVQWHSSMVQFLGSKEISLKGNMNQTNSLRIFLTVIFTLVCIVLILLFGNQIDSYIGVKIHILLIFFIISKVISELLIVYLYTIRKNQISAIFLFIVEIMIFATLVYLKIELISSITIMTLLNLFNVILFRFVNKQDFVLQKIDKSLLETNLKFAIWQLVGSLSIYIMSYGDNYIIRSLFTFKEIGVYSSAFRLYSSLFLASNIILNFYASDVSGSYHSKDKRRFFQIYKFERKLILILVLIIHIFLFIFSDNLFRILYG